ncbi:DUF4384 domain-containing protein [Leptospira sp. 96542]|nr:DUF4384 domain-containing protein [Leptospira sp. 96542]
MKRFIYFFLFLSLTLFSNDKKENPPLFIIAVESTNLSEESLALRDHIRSQLKNTARGKLSLPILGVAEERWDFDSNGNASLETSKLLGDLNHIQKIVLVSSGDGDSVITFIDVLSKKLEYKNVLPESLTKTLVVDFLSFLDKKNIYLALTDSKNTQTGTLIFNSIKSKYIAGEPIHFEIESVEDNYVYVVLIPENAKEEPVLLFPNPLQSNNFMKKGNKITIPDKRITLKASSVSSKDKIRAFASREEWKEIQLRGKNNESFYKLLPPAITGTKSRSLTFSSITEIIGQTPMTEWEFQISTQ